MEESVLWKANDVARATGEKACIDFLGANEIKKAWNFHKSFANYSVTPLRRLSNLARYLGISDIFVKDEAYRFGLNAFKVLGGSYAIGMYLAQKLNMAIEELSFEKLQSKEIKAKLGNITFTTATDGNHGRGVAWAAQQIGQKAVIYMPKGSSQVRLENIKATGAEGYITDLNYDDTVRLASENARKHGWLIVQDTAWEGYKDIPTWIMQGYGTMVAEALVQLNGWGIEQPTHIFVQAGVGSLAGSVQGVFASVFGNNRPITVIVEPNAADCIYKSAMSSDGSIQKVGGDLNTIMAGLACGEPNPIAWNILKDYSDMMISCPDYAAARGMRILGNPVGDDSRVISGESGAVTTGILSLLLQCSQLREAKEKLNLNENAKVLVFNTEGDTDPEHYRKVVWNG